MKTTYTAFLGSTQFASGNALEVTLAIKQAADNSSTVLVFDDQTGKQVDFDLSGSEQEIQQRYDATTETVKKVGRPKLGVIAREITLQQKHWDWLDQQSASASAVIRKLIDQELNNPHSESNIMLAKQATDRFMSAMLGNMPNYEEATRALYQGNREVFLKMIQDYPKDIHQHILKLSNFAF